MQELLEHIDVEPEHTAEASVIFLHGLGADGHDLEPVIKELDLPDDLQIRYIFPHAPMRAITINGGEEMRGWYDFIPHSESEGSEDIKASSNSIYEFIRREMNRGISSQKFCWQDSPRVELSHYMRHCDLNIVLQACLP